jgi:hypothetical protein
VDARTTIAAQREIEQCRLGVRRNQRRAYGLLRTRTARNPTEATRLAANSIDHFMCVMIDIPSGSIVGNNRVRL